jgi:hypothetical protein
MACVYQYKNQQFKTKQELLNFMSNEYTIAGEELYNSQFQNEEQTDKTIDENPFRNIVYNYFQSESTIPISKGKLKDLSNNNNYIELSLQKYSFYILYLDIEIQNLILLLFHVNQSQVLV